MHSISTLFSLNCRDHFNKNLFQPDWTHWGVSQTGSAILPHPLAENDGSCRRRPEPRVVGSILKQRCYYLFATIFPSCSSSDTPTMRHDKRIAGVAPRHLLYHLTFTAPRSGPSQSLMTPKRDRFVCLASSSNSALFPFSTDASLGTVSSCKCCGLVCSWCGGICCCQ